VKKSRGIGVGVTLRRSLRRRAPRTSATSAADMASDEPVLRLKVKERRPRERTARAQAARGEAKVKQLIAALFKPADAIESASRLRLRAPKDSHNRSSPRAFRGELVPTEAKLARRDGCNYESASTLLDRIRMQRDNSIAPNRARRNRRGATLYTQSNS
jgi:hypothetical protein